MEANKHQGFQYGRGHAAAILKLLGAVINIKAGPFDHAFVVGTFAHLRKTAQRLTSYAGKAGKLIRLVSIDVLAHVAPASTGCLDLVED